MKLAGDGALPDGLAAVLAAHRHTRVVTYDPSASRTCEHTGSYVVGDRLARYLTGLWRHCAFAGCRVPVPRCDWDHVIAYPAGPTCAGNLIPLCRHHRRLKTHTAWQVVRHPDGGVQWRSPAGLIRTVYPDEDAA